MSSRPIIVGYDGSVGARAAARWALDEGARTAQPVRLAYAFDWVTGGAWIQPAPAVWPDEVARRDVQTLVDAAVADAAKTHPGVEVSGVVLDGPAVVRLQEHSRHAAALVLGSRGHGGFGALLVGSTAVSLAAHAHCPVVVVRGRPPAPDQAPRHIVVGVDGSPCAQLALGYAFEQAADRHVPLHVVRAWAPPAAQWRPADFDPAKITAAERSALAQALVPWQEKYPDV
ncbi:MAG TPA: universal stress protein, partial [Micromonosporaceae bacterium]